MNSRQGLIGLCPVIVVPCQAAVGGRVGLVVDLSSMSYTLQHPWALDCMRPAPGGGMYIPQKSLDVHINISTPVSISVRQSLTQPAGQAVSQSVTQVSPAGD